MNSLGQPRANSVAVSGGAPRNLTLTDELVTSLEGMRGRLNMIADELARIADSTWGSVPSAVGLVTNEQPPCSRAESLRALTGSVFTAIDYVEAQAKRYVHL